MDLSLLEIIASGDPSRDKPFSVISDNYVVSSLSNPSSSPSDIVLNSQSLEGYESTTKVDTVPPGPSSSGESLAAASLDPNKSQMNTWHQEELHYSQSQEASTQQDSNDKEDDDRAKNEDIDMIMKPWPNSLYHSPTIPVAVHSSALTTPLAPSTSSISPSLSLIASHSSASASLAPLEAPIFTSPSGSPLTTSVHSHLLHPSDSILSHSSPHVNSHSNSHSLTSHLNSSSRKSIILSSLIIKREEPSPVFYQAVSLGLGQPFLKLILIVPTPSSKYRYQAINLSFHNNLSFLDFKLEILHNLPFKTLVTAYTFPLLWIFTPGIAFIFSIFQVISLLTRSISYIYTDPEQPISNMNPYSATPFLSLGSPSSSSSSPQNQLRQQDQSGEYQASHNKSQSNTLAVQHPYFTHSRGQHEIDIIHSAVATNNSGGSSHPIAPSQHSHSHISPHDSQNQNPSQTQHRSERLNHLQVHFNQNSDQPSHVYDEDDVLDEEDRQSEEGSEGEPGSNDMEYWLQRCSICFDSRLDFCLEICRDQFCRDCFQRYVKEVVSNSWGLNVTKIKCPVCQDTIAQSEWIKYVDHSTLIQYNQYNQPYRSFSRFCNECEHESVISHVNRSVIGIPVRELRPIFENLLLELKSVLAVAGLNTKEPGLSQRQSSKSKTSQNIRILQRDERAREIVQRFKDDYVSFCGGEPQGLQQSLPSKAQSYLSNLALRTLGGPFITQPTSLAVSSSSNHTNSTSQSQNQPSTSSSPPSLPQIAIRQSKAAHQSVPESRFNITLQQNNHNPKVSSVLEIYKTLMIPLLNLLDLSSDNKTESKDSTQYSCNENTAPNNNVDETENVTDESESASSAMELESDLETKRSKRKGNLISSTSKSKRSKSTKSSIVTRAEKKRQLDIKRSISRFSKSLSSIETNPEQWKELQFLHVRWLRWEWCENCDQEMCLQCGESSHHGSQGCSEYMRSLITANNTLSSSSKAKNKTIANQLLISQHSSNSLDKGKNRQDLDSNTIQWKLANTNPCPNCCILIHRDDGCNKVDCMLCGYRFCWICRESWGSACGFFNCGRQPVTIEPTTVESDNMIDESTENKHLISLRERVSEEEQVQLLAVSQDISLDTTQDQIDLNSLQDLQKFPEVLPYKPEIGVPNVFVIHTKRSRS